MEMNERQFTVTDAEGNEILCNILFTFESEVAHKDVVVFYPAEENDDEDIELSAAFFVEGENGQGDLEQIEDEEVWAEIEDAVASFEEETGCCCCGEECECGEECDCEEEHEGCCCHHQEK